MVSGAILAAGRGSRLAKVTGGMPKAFVKVFGNSLLTLQAISLKRSGARNLVAIISPVWKAEAVTLMEAVTPNYLVVSNSRFFLENGYSFYLALKHSLAFSDKAVITVVDHIYEIDVIKDVLTKLNEGASLVIAGDRKPKYIDVSEATKIKRLNNELVISKGLRAWDWIDMGVFAATYEAMKHINKCMTPNPKIAEIITCLSKHIRVEVAEFEGIRWCDIDSLEDYLSLYYGRRKKIIEYLNDTLTI